MSYPFPVWGRRGASLCGLGLWWALSPAAWSAPLAQPDLPNAPPPSVSWREANDRVGQFPRGHADVLAWERQHTPPGPGHRPDWAPLPPPQAWLQTALEQRPDLWVTPGDGLADAQAKHRATAAWSLTLLRTWWQAAAARRDAELASDALEAAHLGAELARRMAQVGNWSEAKRLQAEQTLRMNQREALQAVQEAQTLTRSLYALSGVPPAPAPHPEAVPSTTSSAPSTPPAVDWKTLPPPPTDAEWTAALALPPQDPQGQRLYSEHLRTQAQRPAAPQALALHAAATQVVRPHANLPTPLVTQAPTLDPRTMPLAPATQAAWAAQGEWQAWQARWQAQALQAMQQLDTTRALARLALEQTLPAAQALEDDSQRRYNGMLQSTWERLDATRARIQAERDATGALRDAWLAHLNWQAVQAGLSVEGH